jgi:signal peptidase I
VEPALLGLSLALSVPLGAVTALKGKWGMLVLGLVFWPAWVLGAIRLARPNSYWARRFYDEEKRARAERVASSRRKVAIAGAAAVVLLLAAVLALFKFYRIPSSAMEPTLSCSGSGLGCTAADDDRILAFRYLLRKSPKRGDIVAFKTPPQARTDCGAGGTYVKRIIGLPGETWEIRNGFVYIDGRQLDEPYLRRERRDQDTLPRHEIPEDSYLVLGDNRPQSCDSRVWGVLPRENLVAKVIFRYWPLDRLGTP